MPWSKKNKVWQNSETDVRSVWLGKRKQEENIKDEYGEKGKAKNIQGFVGSSREVKFYYKTNGTVGQ